MEEMKKEKSCGAVIYKVDENERISFLLIKQKTGHFGFPKGHVENDETEVETATREVKEETNLDVIIDTSFRMISTYSPVKGVLKDVIYFLAKPTSEEIIPQEEEVEVAIWCNYYVAKRLLTHRQNKNILRNALNYIKRNVLNKRTCIFQKRK